MTNRFSKGLPAIKEVARGSPLPPRLARETRSAYVAPAREGKVAIQGYYDPAVRKQLAIMSVMEDRSQQELLAEALNLLFEKYSKPPIAN
jgi:hypothetical protein